MSSAKFTWIASSDSRTPFNTFLDSSSSFLTFTTTFPRSILVRPDLDLLFRDLSGSLFDVPGFEFWIHSRNPKYLCQTFPVFASPSSWLSSYLSVHSFSKTSVVIELNSRNFGQPQLFPVRNVAWLWFTPSNSTCNSSLESWCHKLTLLQISTRSKILSKFYRGSKLRRHLDI